MSRAARVAAAAALLIAACTGAGADGPTPPPAPTDMQLGRLLLQAGRLQDAHAFLEQARPAGEEEAVARLFMLGRIEMRLGLPRKAAERFEAILARRPDLTRVRLELASAYFAAKRGDKARHHLEAALADRLPASVEAAVRGFLDRIDSRGRWSWSFSAALAPESNPAHRTARRTVRIGGVPWRLDADSRAKSGAGVQVSGGVSFSPVIGDDMRGVLSASGSAKLFRRSAWNDVSVTADIGLALPSDRSSLSGGLRASRRWLGDDAYSRSIGPWMRGSVRVSGRTRVGVASDLVRVAHEDHPDRDGWRWSARPSLFHALGERSALEVDLDLESVASREKRFGSRMAGLNLTVTHVFEGGLAVSPSFGVWHRRYRGRDPIFDRTRTDTTIRPAVKVLYRSLQFGGFTPHVGYSFETVRSSIALYSYRNHAVLAGISRTF